MYRSGGRAAVCIDVCLCHPPPSPRSFMVVRKCLLGFIVPKRLLSRSRGWVTQRRLRTRSLSFSRGRGRSAAPADKDALQRPHPRGSVKLPLLFPIEHHPQPCPFHTSQTSWQSSLLRN
ncbi:hypothetical protein E2C01_078610 [Portunus trituberculatus]|uniref:Uncharacterized protein n=1 Tax=Portunus trituberculatus TaxID=210409 RepID=A0A5B7IP87_PORTR|nr:hypothetical protein [Portunus trituberculatus]